MSDSLLLLRTEVAKSTNVSVVIWVIGQYANCSLLCFRSFGPTLFKLFLVLDSMTNSVISRRTGIFAAWFVLIRKVGGSPCDNPATQEPSIQIYLWPVLMVLEKTLWLKNKLVFGAEKGDIWLGWWWWRLRSWSSSPPPSARPSAAPPRRRDSLWRSTGQLKSVRRQRGITGPCSHPRSKTVFSFRAVLRPPSCR